MITGAHSIIYSKNSEEDRAFLKDVLKFPYVDVGHGWLIFGLPPSEVAVHPSDKNGTHELYLMCDDIEAFLAEMKKRRVATDPVSNQGWGLLSAVTLPGGGKLGVYQPRHARPESPGAAPKAKRAAKPKAKATAKKPAKAGAAAKKAAPKKRAAKKR
jgi:hypothetical protein